MGMSNFAAVVVYILCLLYYPCFSVHANWPSGLCTGTDDTDTTTAPTALTAPTSEGNFRRSWEGLGVPWGCLWKRLGGLGCIFGGLGRLLDRLGTLFELSWGVLERLGDVSG